MDMSRQYELPILTNIEPPLFHEGDILVLNTTTDRVFPSDYVGKYHIHILCQSGQCKFKIAEKQFSFRAGDFVAWTIDTEVTEAVYTPDFNAEILLVSRNFLLENNPQSTWATKGYLYIKEEPVFHLTSDDMDILRVDFRRFKAQLEKTDHLFRREILGKLIQIFLYNLWNIYATELNRLSSINNTSANLFARFLDLVRQRCTVDREVTYYADQLCVTPKYLSEVSKKVSGYPANYWINRYTALDIARLLRDKTLTFVQISDMFHFSSPAYFSRYVQRTLGLNPTQYRE